MMEGPCADSEEKQEPVSDIDTVMVDSLKVLDPRRPIREADIRRPDWHVRKVPYADIRAGLNFNVFHLQLIVNYSQH